MSTRKTLFERPPPTDKDQTVTTTQSRKWVTIKKSGSNTNKDTGTLGRGRKAVFFVADTNFATREIPPVKKTPAKEAATKLKDCVVKLRLKIFHSVNNIQELVLGIMDYCLSILHEHDKKARFVNKKKSLEAYKVTDLPCDFTDFYDKWGEWDETVRAFLNTIPAEKS